MTKTEKQINRITQMEEILNRVNSINASLETALDDFCAMQSDVKKLGGYYGGAAWRQDVSDDEDGLLPLDLPRGVLSEDGAYSALSNYREQFTRMLDIVSKALQKGII